MSYFAPSCPSWCEIADQRRHRLHFHAVAVLGDTVVTISAWHGEPDRAEVSVITYDPGTGERAGIPPLELPPTVARCLGQALIARGRDRELGELLVRAADLLGEA